ILDEPSRIIASVNGAFCRLMGGSEDAFTGKSVLNFVDESERARFDAGLMLCAQNGQGTLSDVALIGQDGRKVFMDVSLTFINVMREHLVCLTFKDTTEAKPRTASRRSRPGGFADRPVQPAGVQHRTRCRRFARQERRRPPHHDFH
ncbi:MAG TPA: PAS domain-containing protein, partial [Candidatus Hydrogenedentes bacterium]|nr:PAS domain-containing protein [Candidatus Hydrogenedentota bacterium]